MFVVVFSAPAVRAQKVIEYVAGMGTRDPDNADIWILYQNVKAMHDGMTLYTDSASFDTKNNIFVAHRNVKMVITDTTDFISTAFVSLKGYTQDTLYMSFAEDCFCDLKLIGNIDTTFRNDWYDETLPVFYHTRTTTDGDSVVLMYSID